MVDRAVAAQVPVPQRRRMRRRIERMLRAAALSEEPPRPLEVSLRLTDDDEIRALNRDYRGKDTPTDVLAFAMREGPQEGMPPLAAGEAEYLGDLIISVPTAAQQLARKRPMDVPEREPLLAELLFLSAHGLCHLLGYDHQDDAEEAEMNARMAELLAECARTGSTRAA
ncbi:rRNA maturation RNase YbeY [Haliangium ochraceum]|nr:rRNA maturation RNase YbeY [Haliangium ochraceum]